VKLYEHADFRQLIARVANERKVAEAWVEKDYYLTEVLRLIAQTYPKETVLKGGTSLSKGWLLLDRISEDIDLFLDPEAFPAPAGKAIIGAKTIDKKFSRLKDAIKAHPALEHERVKVYGGFAREDRFKYKPLFSGGPFTITPSVLLEAGIQSGRQPLEVRPIFSLLAQFLEQHGQSAIADDTTAFEMQVLHYRRTFVEKMFAIHAKVVRFAEGGDRIGRAARHYADLYVLAGQEDVRTMLGQTEYADIRNDYDEKSRKFFGKSYLPPADLRFNASPALFPDAALRHELQADYDRDVTALFFAGRSPSFDAVLARLQEIRTLL